MAIVLGGVVLSTVVSSATAWYLSMNKTMSGTNDKLEAMTIAMSEWQRLEHMSLEELEANRENYKNPYNVGDKFKVGINLGEQGFFDDGKCNSLTGQYAAESANCFKDTIMTVYDKDGSAMYTTRSLPLSVGGASIPEGTIWPYTGDLAKIPRGWVLCDGTNGTPDLTDRFLEGTKTTTGVFKDAGLPNIDGNINAMTMGSFRGNGAIYMNSLYQDSLPPDGANDFTEMYGSLNFNASRSNTIYGRSETVQPKSYTVFYIMKTNKDFHYNHTNGVVSPSYYTKEEVDNLLKGERNYTSNNYLNKASKDYVRNLSPSYTLGLGYSENDKAIHGNVDGEEAPFASAGKNEIVEEWHSSDGLGYYRKYANGWVEQGGCIPQSPTIGAYQTRVNLYIPFKDSNYLLLTQHQLPGYNYNTCSFDYILGNQKQVNYFVIQTCSHFNYYYWKAEGFYK